MKILLVADGRSPITHGWASTLKTAGFDVVLVSTFICPPVHGIKNAGVIPAAFSSVAGSQVGSRKSNGSNQSGSLISRFRNLFMLGRYWLGPATLPESRRVFLEILEKEQPDIVHALRIPFEGMVSRITPPEIPFVVSIWGNDLTLHAHGSPFMGYETRQTLKRADGLMADASRDLRLALDWGLKPDVPAVCFPGGGGIDLQTITDAVDADIPLPVDLPLGDPVVINPRGFRPGSVRNDTFFQSIPLILEEIPETIFVCVGMADQPEAMEWVEKLDLTRSVRLLPFLKQEDLWRLFRRSTVSMSISQHDGTPNSLLEAMALGCYPVVGNIESTREWITDGQNGRLVQPDDENGAARAVIEALKKGELIKTAALLNRQIISDRVDRDSLAGQMTGYYQTILRKFE